MNRVSRASSSFSNASCARSVASGHQVAAFTRHGEQTDNLEVWDPENLPSGLYVARLRFHGATTDRTETVPVALLR